MTLLWFVLMVRIGMRVMPSLIVSQPHDSIATLRKECQRRPDATYLHEVHLLLYGALLHMLECICVCSICVYMWCILLHLRCFNNQRSVTLTFTHFRC